MGYFWDEFGICLDLCLLVHSFLIESWLTYVLDLVDGPEEDDKTIEQLGIKLHVPKKSYVFLAGTMLDYSSGLNGKGFVFNNPNAKTTCGCGTSFGV